MSVLLIIALIIAFVFCDKIADFIVTKILKNKNENVINENVINSEFVKNDE